MLLVEFFDLKQRTRRSIKKTWQNYLSNDWLKPEKAKKMPLSKLYTDLVWTKKVKGIRDTSEDHDEHVRNNPGGRGWRASDECPCGR